VDLHHCELDATLTNLEACISWVDKGRHADAPEPNVVRIISVLEQSALKELLRERPINGEERDVVNEGRVIDERLDLDNVIILVHWEVEVLADVARLGSRDRIVWKAESQVEAIAAAQTNN